VVRLSRRLIAAAAGVILLAVVIIAVASAGSNQQPRFSFGALSVASSGPARPVRPVAALAFRPAPAAVAMADRLPLADQVAQLFMVGLDGSGSDAVASVGIPDVGGVVLTSANFTSDAEVGALTAALRSAARTAAAQPPLIAATQEGGPETAFPDLPPESEPAIGATGRPAVARAQALLAGQHLRALGVEMTLAPLADVNTLSGALSGRLFSSDPQMVARFALAAVDGYQAAGVISAVGHFPGSGAASADPDQTSATVGLTLPQLEARDLIPFAAVARSAPVILMSNAAYVALDGVTPASLLGQAVSLLRNTYGFGGVVMTDDLDATLDPTGSGPGQVAVQALQAGDDLLYISGPASEHLAAYDGVLAAAQRSASVRALVRAALLRDETLKVDYSVPTSGA
jgi:beta-N-acetylhexosaminidase